MSALSRARKRLASRRKSLAYAKRLVTSLKKKVAASARTVTRLQRARKGPERALAYSSRFVGHVENPTGSNRSKWIDKWVGSFSSMRGVSWCGAFAGYCLRVAGVQGLTSRVLYVPYIIEDAKLGRNGFVKFVKPEDIRKGDLVCMDFGNSGDTGEHVAIARGNYDALTKTVATREGNTSLGSVGAQANGWYVANRERHRSVIVGGARPNWP